jgi:hypothetical protein
MPPIPPNKVLRWPLFMIIKTWASLGFFGLIGQFRVHEFLVQAFLDLHYWCGWLRWYPNPDATLLRGWIWFSPIVNPLLHLISLYVYCFITLYKLDVTSWSFGTALSSGPRVLRFYTCLLQGVYIAGHSDSDCLRCMVYLYYIEYIEYACYVTIKVIHHRLG